MNHFYNLNAGKAVINVSSEFLYTVSLSEVAQE